MAIFEVRNQIIIYATKITVKKILFCGLALHKYKRLSLKYLDALTFTSLVMGFLDSLLKAAFLAVVFFMGTGYLITLFGKLEYTATVVAVYSVESGSV